MKAQYLFENDDQKQVIATYDIYRVHRGYYGYYVEKRGELLAIFRSRYHAENCARTLDTLATLIKEKPLEEKQGGMMTNEEILKEVYELKEYLEITTSDEIARNATDCLIKDLDAAIAEDSQPVTREWLEQWEWDFEGVDVNYQNKPFYSYHIKTNRIEVHENEILLVGYNEAGDYEVINNKPTVSQIEALCFSMGRELKQKPIT